MDFSMDFQLDSAVSFEHLKSNKPPPTSVNICVGVCECVYTFTFTHNILISASINHVEPLPPNSL